MSPKAATGNSESGFTLLELLIALVLLGFLSALLFGAIRFGARAWERSTAVATQVDDIHTTQALLRRLLSEVYPMLITADATRPRIDFAGEAASIDFLAPVPEALGAGGRARFTLGLREHGGLWQLVIASRPELAKDEAQPSSSTGSVLLSAIERFEFSYFGSLRPGDPPAWHESWSRQTSLPQLIRMRLEFPGGDHRSWPELVVAPRITVDQGCLYDPVNRGCRGR